MLFRSLTSSRKPPQCPKSIEISVFSKLFAINLQKYSLETQLLTVHRLIFSFPHFLKIHCGQTYTCLMLYSQLLSPTHHTPPGKYSETWQGEQTQTKKMHSTHGVNEFSWKTLADLSLTVKLIPWTEIRLSDGLWRGINQPPGPTREAGYLYIEGQRAFVQGRQRETGLNRFLHEDLFP